MLRQQKVEPRSAVQRIDNFIAAAWTERLTPEVRRLFKRNILCGPARSTRSLTPTFSEVRKWLLREKQT
jgi:hypothetical protein